MAIEFHHQQSLHAALPRVEKFAWHCNEYLPPRPSRSLSVVTWVITTMKVRWRRWRRRRRVTKTQGPLIREKEREITWGMSNSKRNSTRSIFFYWTKYFNSLNIVFLSQRTIRAFFTTFLKTGFTKIKIWLHRSHFLNFLGQRPSYPVCK